MELLVVRKPFRSGNELLKTGDKFLIEDGQGLVERGYARRLTQDETRAILEDYVQCTRELFAEEPEMKPITYKGTPAVQGSLFNTQQLTR